jgi:hypothetical protein
MFTQYPKYSYSKIRVFNLEKSGYCPFKKRNHWGFPKFGRISSQALQYAKNKQIPGLVWLPSFGARIKEFIYNSSKYLFGCHGIGYGIHFEFHGFSFYA